jgi:hypothetical protein
MTPLTQIFTDFLVIMIASIKAPNLIILAVKYVLINNVCDQVEISMNPCHQCAI